MIGPDRLTLQALPDARQAIATGLFEARDLMERPPRSSEEFAAFDLIKRTAARAFLKAFEQLQDITAKLIRTILLLEDEDLSGLSARGIAERAEALELIGSAERWSAVVRLRNRLVHEYPLDAEGQFRRFIDVFEAHSALLAIISTILAFLRAHDYPGVTDD